MTTILADTETDGFLDEASVIWAIGTYNLDTRKYEEFNDQKDGCRSVREGLAYLRDADTVVFHNGVNFDLPVIEKLHPDLALDPTKLDDTMVMSRLLNPERRSHKLDDLGEDLFSFGKHDFHDFSRYSKEMSDYLRQDIRVLYLLYDYLKPRLETWGESPVIEHRFAHIISLQMQNGFPFDEEGALKLLQELELEEIKLRKGLQKIFPPIFVKEKEFTPKRDNAKMGYTAGCPLTKIKLQTFNPGSTQQVAERLTRKYNWQPTMFTPTGAPQITEDVLKELGYPEARALAEYQTVAKKISQLNSDIKADGSGGGWLKHLKADGRIHGYVNSNGAVTGRCTHSKPNTGNIDKDERMRALFIPRAGWKLTGCDAEGLELRMLGHYLAPWDNGAYIQAVTRGKKEDGTDQHTMLQKALGLFRRDGAKTFIYAMIYGAGDPKLGSIILDDAKIADKLNPTDAPHLYKANGKLRSRTDLGKEARERAMTGIVGLGELIKTVKRMVKERGYLIGLDGRHLRIRSDHSALNTLLQGGGAIVMKKAAILFHELVETIGYKHGKDFAYCANVHDEVQMECFPDYADVLGKTFAESITRAGQDLKVRCPLAGAYDVGNNWAETH